MRLTTCACSVPLILLAIPAYAAPQQVFFTDFNAALPPQFTGVTTLESVQGLAGIGHPGNTFSGNFLRNTTGGDFFPGTGNRVPGSPTTLTLTNLPAHNSVSLRLLVAALDSWDGRSSTFPGDFANDRFNVLLDGQSIFTAYFNNSGVISDSVGYTANPPLNLTPHINQPNISYGFGSWPDYAYDMTYEPAFANIPHTAPTLTLQFFADGGSWEGGDAESWAIDNLGVTINTVPEPVAPALLLALPHLIRRRRPTTRS
jgi:hypothetical protein